MATDAPILRMSMPATDSKAPSPADGRSADVPWSPAIVIGVMVLLLLPAWIVAAARARLASRRPVRGRRCVGRRRGSEAAA